MAELETPEAFAGRLLDAITTTSLTETVDADAVATRLIAQDRRAVVEATLAPFEALAEELERRSAAVAALPAHDYHKGAATAYSSDAQRIRAAITAARGEQGKAP